MRLALATIALVCTAAAVDAAPATLSCASETGMNWWSVEPQIVGMDDESFGSPIVHLNPYDGEWHLQVPGSRALVNDGGTFEIVRTSEFGAYHHEWVGIDQDTMLRIRGGGDAPMRFLFIADDWGPVVGTCVEPDETFVLLGKTESMMNLNDDWRDTTSDRWVIRWGVDHDLGWVEAALGLTPGSYEQRELREWLAFLEPYYGETKELGVYDFVGPDGRVHKVLIGEVSNNIWAIGYWAGDSNG